MSCLKGKSENKEKPGRFKCKKCGAASKKKGHLCDPKKIKEDSDTKDGAKDKKEKKKKKAKQDDSGDE